MKCAYRNCNRIAIKNTEKQQQQY